MSTILGDIHTMGAQNTIRMAEGAVVLSDLPPNEALFPREVAREGLEADRSSKGELATRRPT